MSEQEAVNVAALREAAEAATPGPWRHFRHIVHQGEQGGDVASTWPDPDARNSAYIAAANPTAILALLDRVQAAEGAVDAVRRRHPRGDEEESGMLAPGLWCPTCGHERTDNGYGACPDRAALGGPR